MDDPGGPISLIILLAALCVVFKLGEVFVRWVWARRPGK